MDMRKERRVTLDVVIPVYNEERVLPHLFTALDECFSKERLQAAGVERVRFRFVDDGSTDQSVHLVHQKVSQSSNYILHILSRNFGHQAAISAGLKEFDANLVAVLDSDLQDPPEVDL